FLHLRVNPRFARLVLRGQTEATFENSAAIDSYLISISRQHYVNLGLDVLVAEYVHIDRPRAPERHNLFVASERDGAGWTHRCAHRLQPLAGTVVTHVTFHLQVHCRIVLGHSERAGVNAVTTVEAAWFESRHYDALFGDLYRVGRTD